MIFLFSWGEEGEGEEGGGLEVKEAGQGYEIIFGTHIFITLA